VITEAFIAGQEPDKDCSGATVAVSKLPYYLQKPFYQPKELEPTQAAADASARSGESAESPAPNLDDGSRAAVPPTATTTSAPPATTTAPPPPY
jgi:hypothetical protein